MAERQPPLWMDGGCYTGEDLRTYFGGIISSCPGGGVVAPGDLLVTAQGAMVVRVAAGSAWVQGSEQVGQGTYLVTAPTTTDLTIAPADPSNPRIDLIVAHVIDPAYTGTGQPRWALEVVQGTPAPAGTQQPPTPPPSSLQLARIAVAAATSVIQTANITDRRVLCSGVGDSPSGTIVAFGGIAAPAGWLMCNGQAVSRTLYGTLFTVLGTRYGGGDGSTTFNVPNLLGRVIAGVDGGQAEFNTPGAVGGSKAATMPYHNHGGSTTGSDRSLGHAHSVNIWSGTENANHTHGTSDGTSFLVQGGGGILGVGGGPRDIHEIGQTGGVSGWHQHYVGGATGGEGAPDHLHYIYGEGSGNNLQPYLAANYIVRI